MGGWSDDERPDEAEACAVPPQAARRLAKVEERLGVFADQSMQLANRLIDLHAEMTQVAAEVGVKPRGSAAAYAMKLPGSSESYTMPLHAPPDSKTPIMFGGEVRPPKVNTETGAGVKRPQDIPAVVCTRGSWFPVPDPSSCPPLDLEIEDIACGSDGGRERENATDPAEKPPPKASESRPTPYSDTFVRRSTTVVNKPWGFRGQNEGGLFVDAEDMKEKIRKQITGKKDDITAYYSETGIFQAVAKSSAFESVSMVVICLNALWIAIEIDNNDAPMLFDSAPIFIVVANLFCVFFIVELVIRVMAFREKRRALKEFWVVFDGSLVLLMVFETWIISVIMAAIGAGENSDATGNLKAFVVLRMLRLLRVLRLARVLRELPELMVIVRALAIAFRAISVVLMLLGIIVYMGAIVFRVLLEDSSVGHDHFESVTSAMGTLLIEMTLSGAKGGPLIRKAYHDNILFSALMLLFVLLANVTVMGVLGGLLVQTVKTVAEMEKEERQVKSMAKMMDELWEVVITQQQDIDGGIHEGHLRSLLTDAKAAKMLQKNGVDLEGLIDVSSFICQQSNGMLSKTQFKRMVLDLRGKNAAKVKDHVETRRFMAGLLKRAARGSTLESS